MKKITLIVVVIIASISSYAQDKFKEDVEVVQSIYGRNKSELIKQYMNLSDEEFVRFTKVYENYETERKALGKAKLDIINNYAANYATLTDAKADELAKNTFKNNLAYEKLYDKTYGQAKKAVGAINAAKFIQLEIYLQTIVRGQIYDSIPFIGELEKSKTN
ncbi:hypothetical protein EV143_105289 [Flavobacterium chryseum]|uniref:hypothetical protein n=1 Tax=Flavobacterium sp. P3160 TaxID=2512113 RepID=UPI00105F55E5|nr:hypothetical protein [Flavobacterium sp. P3160]TDO73689.1 hypothetical protein EV143_105289 [Flavobacterium sp. P3160]